MEMDSNLYGSKLKNSIIQGYYKDPCELPLRRLISKLLGTTLDKLNSSILTEEFSGEDLIQLRNLELLETIGNKEVRACWLGVLITLDRSFLFKNIDIAFEAYKEVYLATKDPFYLVRGFELITRARTIFKDKLEEIFLIGKTAVEKAPQKPFLQKLLAEQMMLIFDKQRCRREFEQYFNDQVSNHLSAHKYEEARRCAESLQVIGALTLNASKVKKAEIREMEGDYHQSQQDPNTHNWAVGRFYQQGLTDIASVPGTAELRNCLSLKAQVQHKAFLDIIRKWGVDLFPPIDPLPIRNFVSRLSIHSLQDAFNELMAIPFPQRRYFRETKSTEESFVYKYMEGFEKVGAKGTVIGKQDFDDAALTHERIYCREIIQHYIRNIRIRMDVWGSVSPELIWRILWRIKSPFVPTARLRVYTEGIAEGFKGDYMKAAHILIPQLENSFRNIGDDNKVVVTKLEEEIQHENTLGSTLTKIRHLANAEFIDELESFLLEGSDVNFRNNIAHGLAETGDMYKYGEYLWWLTLKILYNFDELFPGVKKDNEYLKD